MSHVCRAAVFFALVGTAAAGAHGQTSPAPPAPVRPKPAVSGRKITLAPTRPGNYAYWIVTPDGAGGVATLRPDSATAPLALPADARQLHVLNEADGTLAVYPAVKLADGAAVKIGPGDFKYVRTLVTRVTAAKDRPAASAVVTLTDATGRRAQRVLTAGDRGQATFGNVLRGKATFTASYGADGPKATQQVTVVPAPGGKAPEVTLALPGDVPTITGEAPAPGAGEAATPGAGATEPPPLSPVSPTPEAPLPRDNSRRDGNDGNGANWPAGIVGIGLLAGLGYYALRALRARGMTVAGALKHMGVEAQNAPIEPATPLKPAPSVETLPPLPSLADLPAAGPAAPITAATSAPIMGATSAANAATPTSPRLFGMAGPMKGAIPLDESVPLSIGRDPASTIALAGDGTASRRHARIEKRGDAWFVADEGSTNGTFVNGTEIRTERELRPGDEIAVGSARFRFEA